MYLRYHVKLEDGWRFLERHVVKIPGLAGTYNAGAGGWRPDPEQGSVGWSARLLAGRGPEYPTNQWSPLSYVYHLNQENDTGDHWPYDETEGRVDWNAAPRLQMNQWYRIEQRIKMNDPGHENGLTEVWINGEKDPDLCVYDLAYTTHDTIGINRAWADIHYGGKYRSPADNTLFLDNFHVSTNPTPWSGELVGSSKWSGTILVTGDVTIPDGMDLTIAADTEIRFAANSDETGGGSDTARSELIVEGELVATASGITLGSSNTTDPSDEDWYGIRVKSGGEATLTGVTVKDAKHCAEEESGGTLTMSEVTLSNCGSPPENLRAQWVFDGSHAFGHSKASLSWTDPSDTRITGWQYQKKEGSGTLGSWQTVSDEDASLNTVTQEVDGLKSWKTYRFKVRARAGRVPGPESEVGLSPLPVFTQSLQVLPRGGSGKAQFDLVFSPPVDGPDLPDDAQQVSSGNLRYQLVTVDAEGATNTSDFVDLANFSRLLPSGASLASTFSATDLAPVETTVGGASETQAAAFRQAATLRITGLDPGVTYQIKMRLVASDGATISESTSGTVLGLRWQRPTAGSVALSWTDPNKPFIRTWQYRQRAGSGSWEGWQNVRDPGATTTTDTVSGLEAEETYQFQVRALVPGGPLAESFTVSAAPKPLVAPGTLRADPGHASMTLRWDDANNARITGWQYRQRQAERIGERGSRSRAARRRRPRIR